MLDFTDNHLTPWNIQFAGPRMDDKSAAAIYTEDRKMVAILIPVEASKAEFDVQIRKMAAAPSVLHAIDVLLMAVRAEQSIHDDESYHKASDLSAGVYPTDDNVFWTSANGLSADIFDSKGRVALRISGAHLANCHAGREKFADSVRLMASAEAMVEVLKRLVGYGIALGLRPGGVTIKMAKQAIDKAEPEQFALLKDDLLVYSGDEGECRRIISKNQANEVQWAIKFGGWKIVPKAVGVLRSRNNRAMLQETA